MASIMVFGFNVMQKSFFRLFSNIIKFDLAVCFIPRSKVIGVFIPCMCVATTLFAQNSHIQIA